MLPVSHRKDAYSKCLLTSSVAFYAQQNRFLDLGTKINGRMDALGKRIDELEQHICELAEEAGLDKDAILGNTSRHNHMGSITSTTTNSVITTPSIPRSPVPRAPRPKITSTQIEI